MVPLLQNLLANAVLVTVLAILVAATTKFVRHPPLAHFLWLLVLLKLVTPPLFRIEIPIPTMTPAAPASVVTPIPATQPIDVGTSCEKAARREQPVNVVSVDTNGRENKELADTEALLPPLALAPPFAAETSPSPLEPNVMDSMPEILAPQIQSSGTLPDPTAALSSRWSWKSALSVAGWIWLAGSVLWFAVAAVRVLRFERCLRQAEPAPVSLQTEARRLTRQLSLTRCPAICVVQSRLPPLLWGMTGKGTILLPASLLEQMPPSEQSMIVAHEMAHFARHDHWFRWLEFLILGIYWWFPVAWWARRELHRAAEECCDAWVVWLFPSGARCYARSILETMDYLSGARPLLPVGASGLGQFHSLQRRVRMILSKSHSRRMPWPMRITAAVVGLAILSFSAHGVWGQATAEKAPQDKAEAPKMAAPGTQPKMPEPVAQSKTATPEKPQISILPATQPPSDTLPVGPTPQLGPPGVLPATQPPSQGLPAGPTPQMGQPGAPLVVPATPQPVPARSGMPELPGRMGGTVMPNASLEPSVTPNVEQRLQQLELVTNQILQELRALRSQNSGAVRDYSRPRPNAEVDITPGERAKLRALDDQIRATVRQSKEMQDRLLQLYHERARLTRQNSMDTGRSLPGTVPEDRSVSANNPLSDRAEPQPVPDKPVPMTTPSAAVPENVRDQKPMGGPGPSEDAVPRRE